MTAIIQGAAGKEQKTSAMNRAAEVTMRVRRALWLVLGMLSLSVVLVVLGVYTTTRTESLNVTGHAPGVILTLGSFLGLLGLLLEENRKHLLTAAIVFLSVGIISSFLCLVIDGVCVALNVDIRPLKAGRCQYYSSGSGYIYESFYTTVSCRTLKESCNLSVRSGTCYCCDLYDCANGDYLNNYYEFVGVQSCEDVVALYVLIWTLSSLNLVAFFAGTLVTAVLGSVKCLTNTRLFIDSPGSGGSSPTAPLLMEADSHTAWQLCPGASGVLDSQSSPSSVAPLSESNQPLSQRVHGAPA